MINQLLIATNRNLVDRFFYILKMLFFLVAFSLSTVSFASPSDVEKTFVAIEKVTEPKENAALEKNFIILSKNDKKDKLSFLKNIVDSVEFYFFRAAAEVSILFSQGYIGIQGNNTNQADGIVNLNTLGISKIGFFQTDTNGDGKFGDGGTQGNDLSGSIKFFFNNGTVLVRSGALNWRETTGSRVEVMGFIIDPSQPDYTINYGSGQTFILKSGSTSATSSTIGLKSIFSTFTFTNG
ncbi:MAG: hypothetical protein ACJAZV_001922, partial [Roseivirga sp.]